jgi:sulfhydrogenase subunit beta (sulfur reductase)
MNSAPGKASAEECVIERADFPRLFDALTKRGYRVVGPTRRDGAIIYDDLASVDDLPIGWTDEQDAAVYRLKRRDDDALFGYVVGPHSWKKFLNPPTRRLWSAERTGRGFQVIPEKEETPKFAFLGVRACELRALAIQDKVFGGGAHPDPLYVARREGAFLIAVNCGQAGKTCFCVSMNAGPKADAGFDIALTEILEDGRHYFVAEAGSERGAEVLANLPRSPAREPEKAAARQATANAEAQMGRTMPCPPEDLRGLLLSNLEHPRWDNVAERCLTCANCTMVCPTCFCSTVEDVTDLTGDHAERWQRWDSCFTMDFSYIHGGNVRSSNKARYRQWMTHKLATWFDQFGESGCVGCGRCIAWCPAAIDITEEAKAIHAAPATPATPDALKEESR